MHLQYLTDEKGIQQAVVIPAKEWLAFQEEFNKIKMKLQILTGIENAMKEVEQINKGKKKGKSLKSFLDEL